MFDIGFWELMFIAIIGLLVLGPEKLPGAIRSVTSTFRSVKQTANALKSELNHELRVQELHKNLKQAEEKGMQNLTSQESKAIAELEEAAKSVTNSYKNPTDSEKP
ncbi:twin-arginine translocase subunit TatB [Catenovulum sp. SM1970]|uniref:Sec-independent protein translocase protein TatB n=1 Tax=Marinifaba aquimaris TaxID=2741323 RepID=UPI0015741DAD|nr:Sec-independent protein translocase protein TatB [Marinifaba aquimaris]NTS76955.1 twin-arginine translocase subunit TatB [Marinifaba aquimaris]